MDEGQKLISIINLLHQHKKGTNRLNFSQIFENVWSNRIYLSGLFSYAAGAYLAVFCSFYYDKKVPYWIAVPGLLCIALGVLCFTICTLCQLKDISLTIFDPVSSYLPNLKRKIEVEETLIAALLKYETAEISKAERRLELEKTVISNRVIWFLGSTSKIAVVPVVALGCYIATSFWQKISLSPSVGALALAGVFGLAVGALLSLHVANTIDHFVYCLKEANAQREVEDNKTENSNEVRTAK